MFNRVYRHFDGLARTLSTLSTLSTVEAMTGHPVGKPQTPVSSGAGGIWSVGRRLAQTVEIEEKREK